jgi:hypothetical protein
VPVAGLRRPVAAQRRRRRDARLAQGPGPGPGPAGGRERRGRAGDVPDLAMAELQQVLGGLPGAERLVGVDHRVAGARPGVDQDDRDPRRQRELGLVEQARLEQDHRAVDRLRAQPLVGARPAAERRIGDRQQGDRVAGLRGLLRDRVQGTDVAEALQRRHDHADGVEPAALEGAGGAVRPVPEGLHGLHDPGPGLLVDVRMAVGHPRHRLRRHPGQPGHVGHRGTRRPGRAWTSPRHALVRVMSSPRLPRR